MWQNGLMDNWELHFRPIPDRCLGKIKRVKNSPRKDEAKTARLTLRNLMGAFIVLLIGYVLSVVAYIGENVVHYAT